MNEEIRKAIIQALRDSPTRSEDSLPDELSKQLGVKAEEVFRTMRLMEDAKEIAKEGRSSYRLSLQGEHSALPRLERFKRYMIGYITEHWVAVAALILSLIALLKN